MKSVIILGDGMADHPLEVLGGKTPLEAAHKPHIDSLCSRGEVGGVRTVPEGMSPGSDVANLAVLGYDPHRFYTGRSPLEAVSMGVPMAAEDRAFRANLVTLSDELRFEDKQMLDYSAGEITSAESKELISALCELEESGSFKLYSGISYRNLLLWHGDCPETGMTPPHDISGKRIGDYLPEGRVFLDIMKRSAELLEGHEVNRIRRKNGLPPANCLWLWGSGTRAELPSFNELHGVRGCVISAVDLIKGIAISAGLKSIEVEGATGTIHTNFEGKANAAIDALKGGYDFVYLHLEAPDECGHQFDVKGKIRAIELIDEKIVAPISSYLQTCGEDYRILVMPDHATPVEMGTHTNEVVPYAIFRSYAEGNSGKAYCERSIESVFSQEGYMLLDYFLS